MFKELKPIPVGSTIEQIREHLEESGILNGALIAIRATEFALTGDKEKLLRRDKNIDSICQHEPDAIIEVYNAIILDVSNDVETFGDVVIKVWGIVQGLLAKRGIDLSKVLYGK